MNLKKKTIIDLTHQLSEGIPVWPGDPPIKIDHVNDFQIDGYNMNNISLSEHTGTHLGAPLHFFPFGKDVSQIPTSDLIIQACKINITGHTAKDADYLLKFDDITKWEEHHKKIPAQSLVLIETGWSQYWDNSNDYLGFKYEEMHFPGISQEAIEFLDKERKIKAIGIDSAGIDGGLSFNYGVNKYCSENNIFHLENLTTLDKIDETGATIFIGALPIKRGSGSPCRVLALQ